MEIKYIQKTAEKLGLNTRQVTNIVQMVSEGATIPFMARYRKEATNNLDEVVITNVTEEIKYFTELDKRKETVIKTIEGLGKLTPELKGRIQNTFDATELEDIYLPFKPKRKTRATSAIEKGLEPLATILFEQREINIDLECAKFLNEHIANKDEALQGAQDIIAEWVAENEQARNAVRLLFKTNAIITSKVLKSKKESSEAQKYRDYFEYSEPINRCPSHRMLAIRRGEKEG